MPKISALNSEGISAASFSSFCLSFIMAAVVPFASVITLPNSSNVLAYCCKELPSLVNLSLDFSASFWKIVPESLNVLRRPSAAIAKPPTNPPNFANLLVGKVPIMPAAKLKPSVTLLADFSILFPSSPNCSSVEIAVMETNEAICNLSADFSKVWFILVNAPVFVGLSKPSAPLLAPLIAFPISNL